MIYSVEYSKEADTSWIQPLREGSRTPSAPTPPLNTEGAMTSRVPCSSISVFRLSKIGTLFLSDFDK